MALSSKLSNLTTVKLDLSGRNFVIWKGIIDILLMAERNCYEVAKGILPETDRDYGKANRRARSMIVSSIDPEIISWRCHQDISTMTAASLYAAIIEKFDKKAQVEQNTAMERLSHFQFDPSETPSGNTLKFRQLVSDAIGCGAQPDDSMLVSCLLHALPPSWVFLRQTWDTQPAGSRSINDLCALIEAEQTSLLSEALNSRLNADSQMENQRLSSHQPPFYQNISRGCQARPRSSHPKNRPDFNFSSPIYRSRSYNRRGPGPK